MSGGTWSASVPLSEGNSTLTAVATKSDGTVNTASVQVTLDTTHPRITVEALAERQAFQALPDYERDALIEFLKTLQVLPPGTQHLVVDENFQPL